MAERGWILLISKSRMPTSLFCYRSSVKLRDPPPRPIAIPWSTISQLSWSLNPPPCSAGSMILSGEIEPLLFGQRCMASSSRNWHYDPWLSWESAKTTQLKKSLREAPGAFRFCRIFAEPNAHLGHFLNSMRCLSTLESVSVLLSIAYDVPNRF